MLFSMAMLIFLATTAGAWVVPAYFTSTAGLRMNRYITAMTGYNLGHRRSSDCLTLCLAWRILSNRYVEDGVGNIMADITTEDLPLLRPEVLIGIHSFHLL